MAAYPTAQDYASRYNRDLATRNYAPRVPGATGPTAADWASRYAQEVSRTNYQAPAPYAPPFAPPAADDSRGPEVVTLPDGSQMYQYAPPPMVGGAGGARAAGGLSPDIVAELARNEALRRLRLKQLRENVGADLDYAAQAVAQTRAKQADQYGRQLPMVAPSFLARGLASSGITNTGIARYHQDYRTATAELDTTYAQARAKLLKQIADAEAEAGLGSAMDALTAGDENWQKILDLVARYS